MEQAFVFEFSCIQIDRPFRGDNTTCGLIVSVVTTVQGQLLSLDCPFIFQLSCLDC